MLKGNVSKAFLLACLMVGLVSGVAFAAVTTFTQRFIYNGDTYTMKHNYEPGTSSWNGWVRSESPRIFSYLGGSTWSQRRICAGMIVASQNRRGWANYNSSSANSSVEWYSYASGSCVNERMGIYALHQWQDYGWQSPISHDYTTGLARP